MPLCSSATAALRSPATKQRARPDRCHRQVARGQGSVIVEHTDDDRREDRQCDKQHHYADHDAPRSSRWLHARERAAWHELGKAAIARRTQPRRPYEVG
jgi:hypothetical protein